MKKTPFEMAKCPDENKNVATNSFHTRRSDICKHILQLQEERASEKRTEEGPDSCEQNKTLFVHIPHQ